MDGQDDGGDLLKRLKRAQGEDAQALAELVERAGRRFPDKRKGIRAEALRRAFSRAAELAQALDWRGSVTLRGGRVIVDVGGVPFHGDNDERFFHGGGGSPAKRLLKTLDERGIVLHTVFDVGANIGELSLYIASRRPNARVIAFEPAPENLLAFEENRALHVPPLANLRLIREAVSDRSGEIEIIVGAHALNTVMIEANLERIETRGEVERVMVPTDTLEGYCRRLGVGKIDFLKVDIEGAEPLLADSVAAMPGRIGSALVEISPFNSVEAYLRLVKAFEAAGLVMADDALRPIGDPWAWISRSMAAGAAPNVWFLPPATR